MTNFYKKRCDIVSIGERITQLRKDASLSQGQLAESLGISRQAVSKWENDTSCPDTINLIRLAEALNSEVEYIATGRKPVYEHPVVINLVKTPEKVIEKTVEKPVEVPVPMPPKTVVKRVTRIRYRRNPLEYVIVGVLCFLVGICIGMLL